MDKTLRFGVWADNHIAYVRPEEKGDWVKHSDYERLKIALQGLVEACDDQRKSGHQVSIRIHMKLSDAKRVLAHG